MNDNNEKKYLTQSEVDNLINNKLIYFAKINSAHTDTLHEYRKRIEKVESRVKEIGEHQNTDQTYFTDIDKLIDEVTFLRNKVDKLQAELAASVTNQIKSQYQQFYTMYQQMQQSYYDLQNDFAKITSEMDDKVKSAVVSQAAALSVQQKPAAVVHQPSITIEKKEPESVVYPIKNKPVKTAETVKEYPFIKDYCRMGDSEFKKKYQCKEMNFHNFQDVRNGVTDKAEFLEESGNYFLFTQGAQNYLLPMKFFLENQNSRMQVCYFFEIDYENRGQLLADHIISPAIIKKVDSKNWVCIKKGIISR